MLDDAAADFEVGHHLGVHDGGHAAPGALDELADFGDEGGESVRLGFGRGERFLGGRRLFHEAGWRIDFVGRLGRAGADEFGTGQWCLSRLAFGGRGGLGEVDRGFPAELTASPPLGG